MSRRDLSVEIFDQKLSMPVLVGRQRFIAWHIPTANSATARAAVAAGTIMVLSSLSTTSMEEVAAAADPAPGVMLNCSGCRVPGPLWFQLYINENRGFTRDLVARVAHSYPGAGRDGGLARVGPAQAQTSANAFHLPPGINAVNLLPSNERARPSATRAPAWAMPSAGCWMLRLPGKTWSGSVRSAGCPSC